MFYHLRVSVTSRDRADELIDLFNGVFPLYAYVFGFESKDENLHIHGHIQYQPDFDPTQSKNKVKRSEFFKKMKALELVPDKNESNYHEVCKDELKNLAYVIKDCDVLRSHNISEDLMRDAEERVSQITEEKKTPMKEQLYSEWIRRDRLFCDKLEAFIFIDNYHVERDYLPPNMTNKIQYSLYIIIKFSKLRGYSLLDRETYKLIGALNSVREHEAMDSYVCTSGLTHYDETMLERHQNKDKNISPINNEKKILTI